MYAPFLLSRTGSGGYRELWCLINHFLVFLWLWTKGDGKKNSVCYDPTTICSALSVLNIWVLG